MFDEYGFEVDAIDFDIGPRPDVDVSAFAGIMGPPPLVLSGDFTCAECEYWWGTLF